MIPFDLGEVLSAKDRSVELLVNALRTQITLRGTPINTAGDTRMAQWEGDLLAVAHTIWSGMPSLRSHPDVVELLTTLLPYARDTGRMRALRHTDGANVVYLVSWPADDDPEPEPPAADPQPLPEAAEADQPEPEAEPAPAAVPALPTSGQGVHRCDACGYADPDAGSFRIHVQKLKNSQHPREGDFPCPHCQANLVTVDSYRNHSERRHRDQYKGWMMCRGCLGWYESRRDLADHRLDCDGVKTPRPHPDVERPEPEPQVPAPRPAADDTEQTEPAPEPQVPDLESQVPEPVPAPPEVDLAAAAQQFATILEQYAGQARRITELETVNAALREENARQAQALNRFRELAAALG